MGTRYWRNLTLFGLCTLLVGLSAGIGVHTRRGALGYVHPPRGQRSPGDTPARFGVPYQEVSLQTADGLRLAAWYTPPGNGALILVAHGYQAYRSAEMHAYFAQQGYGAVSWDFRAHGESGGELCTLGYDEALDVEAALDFGLAQPGVRHVGAWGGSMGAAAVIEAAARRPEIEAVIADSGFPTLEEEMELMITSNLLRPLIRFFAEREAGLDVMALRPVDSVGLISPRPLLLIQGAADDTIPADAARRMYEAADEPRTLWVEPGVGHMGVRGARPEEYERRVIGLFNAALVNGG